MRPIHLGLAALVLAAALAALWVWLGAPTGVAHAGASSRAGARAGSAAPVSANGTAGQEGGGPGSGSDSAGGRVALAPAEDEMPGAKAPKHTELPKLDGRVVDPAGSAVPGATVFASSGVNWVQIPLDVEPEALPKGWIRVETTTTDAEGRFLFEDLKPGPLRIAVHAPGFAPHYEDHLDLPDRPQCTLPDLRMEPGVVLEGRVVDADGKGVAGATLLSALDGKSSTPGTRLALPGRGVPVATTDASGAFRVAELAAGPWRLIVDAPGQAISEEEGRTDHPGERQSGLVFRVERGFEILGRVRAEVGSLPESLRIGARPSPEQEAGRRGPANDAEETPEASDTRARYALCGPDGSFVVRGVKSGVRYALTLAQASDDPGGWKRVRASDPAYAWAGQRGVEILYRPEAALVFRVLDGRSGTPLTSFSVFAGVGREQPLRDEKNQAVHEFTEGRVRFGDLRPRRGGPGVVLRVAASGFKDLERKDLALDPGQVLDLGDLPLEAGPVAVVRVVDERTGSAVAGARVLLSTKSEKDLARSLDSPPDMDFYGESAVRYARTDEKGRARLSLFPGKPVTAMAGARGFLPSAPSRLAATEDGDQDVELKLRHGGSVVVRVLDPSGQPVEGVVIQHKKPTAEGEDEDTDFDRGTLKTDATGTLRFDALAPGAHAFRVSDQTTPNGWFDEERQDASEGWVEAVASEGSSASLEFVAAPRGGLHGEVREGGRPLEGARLHLTEVRDGGEERNGWFSPGANDPFTAVADHEGRYRYEGLRCGSYRLQVSHPSRRMPAAFDVAIENPVRSFDVDLDVATLEGCVVGEDGAPLAGIEVQAHGARGDDESGNWRMVLSEDERGSPRVDYRQEARAADKTDAGGRYSLRGVRTGEPLSVDAGGDLVVHGRIEGITLSPDEIRRNVDFKLKYAGTIEVSLGPSAPGSRSRGWYQVRAARVAEDGTERVVQTNYLGDWNRTCRLRSLEPGKYRVGVSRGSESGRETDPADVQEVDVVAGQVSRIVVQPR